jgi:hypothetical protein
MQSVVSRIITMSGQVTCMIGLFSKNRVRKWSEERQFFTLQVDRIRILSKKIDIPFCHMPNLVMVCICLHNMCIANLDGFDMD